jgi:hypothetical protein
MPKLKIRPRPAKSRPEVVTGSFGLHYEEVVQRRPLLVVLLAVGLVFFAVIIPVAIYHSFASGDFFAAETESGTLSSASLVTKVTDATASGGSYIAFKLPSCPSGQQGTWPNCTPIPQTCPAGQQGTPPNCTTPPVAACTSIAVPAYFYPPSYWAQATSGTPAVKILILDPTTTGAGTSKDPNYATVAANAKAVGIHVLGYADSAYGARPMSELKTEADHYKSWYGVTDMFIDEESPDAADLPYYVQSGGHSQRRLCQNCRHCCRFREYLHSLAVLQAAGVVQQISCQPVLCHSLQRTECNQYGNSAGFGAAAQYGLHLCNQ